MANYKRIWLAAVVISVAAAPAAAAFGDVVASFPAPAPKPNALAWADGYLYAFCKSPPYLVWKIDPATGAPVASYYFSFAGDKTAGLTYDGLYFWAGNRATDRIYRFALGGSVASSFQATWDVGFGLAWTGFHLWGTEHTGSYTNTFYEMRADGWVVHSFTYYYQPYDPAWDGRYLWVGDYDEYNAAYRLVALTEGGARVGSFAAPADQPRGAAFDGTYLWVGTTPDNGWLWRMSVRALAVAPASLGRIKALFR